MKEIIGDDYPTYEESVNMTLREKGHYSSNIPARDFCDDEEKMADFNKLTKQEFLDSYSYLTEEEYQLTMKIVDLDTGQTVYEENADNGPFDLVPHQRDWANWTAPYDRWVDNHTYNISFYATFTDDGNRSGNERFFEIKFYDQIDVAILSNPTDQNRLQQVKNDLNAMVFAGVDNSKVLATKL